MLTILKDLFVLPSCNTAAGVPFSTRDEEEGKRKENMGIYLFPKTTATFPLGGIGPVCLTLIIFFPTGDFSKNDYLGSPDQKGMSVAF